jgi:serine/threonine protein kinase
MGDCDGTVAAPNYVLLGTSKDFTSVRLVNCKREPDKSGGFLKLLLSSLKITLPLLHASGFRHGDLKPDNMAFKVDPCFNSTTPVERLSDISIFLFDIGMCRSTNVASGTQPFSQKTFFDFKGKTTAPTLNHACSVDFFQALMTAVVLMAPEYQKKVKESFFSYAARKLGKNWLACRPRPGWINWLMYHDIDKCTPHFHHRVCVELHKYRCVYFSNIAKYDSDFTDRFSRVLLV